MFRLFLFFGLGNSDTSDVFSLMEFLLAGCFRFCLLFFLGTFRSNRVPGVRFNLLLVLVAFFTGSQGKPAVMGLIIICKKAATVACSLGVAPYNRSTRK